MICFSIRTRKIIPPHLIVIFRKSSTLKSTIFDKPKKFKSEFNYSYVPSILKTIEKRWSVHINKYWSTVIDSTKQPNSRIKPKYILSMFPYPSGQLHLGHIRIYTTSDILFKTSILSGQQSIHPMGFDSFGLPAENAAKSNNQDPFLWTRMNVEQMKQQFNNMNYHFHWRECTSDQSYYRWTQWLFIELYKSGLAYQGVSQVNWDPIDCTVLADEQVDEHGNSWRSGAKVEKRYHKQWLIKTNAFADELYRGEDILDTGHWSMILAHQRWWIKKPNGYLFYFKLNQNNQTLQVFTKYPELFKSPRAFIGISKSHWLANGGDDNSLVGKVCNPFCENQLIDIRIISSVSMPRSTQATLLVLRESFEDENIRKEIIKQSEKLGVGGYRTSDTYRDWLISRQRFWGTPIPIIHCPNCGPIPEDHDNLPVTLPSIEYEKISSFKSQQIASPLQHLAPDQWLKVKCPNCGTEAQRETDTCDTFFDSAWYFLRYFAEPSPKFPFDGSNLSPVSCYVGGKEHAALHLFYARFITHFLHSKGYIQFREPFHTLLMQAIVKGKTYKLNGKYITPEEAREIDSDKVEVTFEKMSKSKGTGVNPDELVDQYGSDAVRWTMISVGNPESERLWEDNEKEFGPTLVFFHRILLTIEEFISAKNDTKHKIKILDEEKYNIAEEKLTYSIDKSVSNVLYSINSSYQIRNGTSTIHKLINSLRSNIGTNVVHSSEFERGLASLLVMLSPITPCFAAECWQAFIEAIPEKNVLKKYGFDASKPVYEQQWPLVQNPDFKYIVRFTYRDENGKEQECSRIQIKLKDLGSWTENEIRNLLDPIIQEEIEWIDIVKHCSVVVRVKNNQIVQQKLKESCY